MNQIEFIVCPITGELSEYIESCVFYKGRLQKFEHRVFRFIPTPYIWLNIPFFHRKIVGIPGSKNKFEAVDKPYFHGFHKSPMAWYVEGEFSGVSLQIKPQAIPSLFGLKTLNLVEKFGYAEEIFGDSIDSLRLKLVASDGIKEKVNLISEYLYTRIYPLHARASNSLKLLMSHGGPSLIKDQAVIEGVSERTLYKDLKQNFHIAPKLLSRISRFWRYAQSLNPAIFQERGGIQPDDYYDDSHLIRDFKFFSSLTPKKYAKHISFAPEAPLGVLLYNEVTPAELDAMQAIAEKFDDFPSLTRFDRFQSVPYTQFDWLNFVYINGNLMQLSPLSRITRSMF